MNNNICVATDKCLSLSGTTIGSKCVGAQSVSGHRLPATHDIEHRIRELMSLFKQCKGGQTGKLCRVLNGLLDCVSGEPAKTGSKASIVGLTL